MRTRTTHPSLLGHGVDVIVGAGGKAGVSGFVTGHRTFDSGSDAKAAWTEATHTTAARLLLEATRPPPLLGSMVTDAAKPRHFTTLILHANNLLLNGRS